MKPTVRTRSLLLFPALLCVTLAAQEHKELGRMWTFENAPLEWFQQAYDFTPSPEWLEHARLSSLRMPSGCSASFVSPLGLIMTNNHCARDAVAKMQGEHDWVRDGYYAGSFDGEVKLPGLSVQQLVATKDVTKEVHAGAAPKDLEKAADEQEPGLKHQCVSLFQGGMYHLYSYNTWKDLRLVCTPHLQSAHFGGDPDNFCFPRYALDFTFLRAYADDKPAETSKFYFTWKTAGPTENELVFVTGNPGSTGRLQTVAQCETLRDLVYPTNLVRVRAAIEQMNKEAASSVEKEKELRTAILGLENTRKAFEGYLDGLRNPRIMEIKQKAEAAIRAAVDADPALKDKYGDAWDKVAELEKQRRELIEAKAKPGEIQKVQTEEREHATRIGEAFFAVYGTRIPPDATFTLRLSDGVVRGFKMNGTIAPYFTSLYGLYARHTEFGGVHPFDVPQPWLEKKGELDLRTPVNFVATCDIIGGNSGSPMIDKQQNVVGLIFDGNIEMLGNNYVFDDEVARTVCVHPAFIVEALRKIYGAGKLADELEQNARKAEAIDPGRAETPAKADKGEPVKAGRGN
ncbi:MAG TPA: S46 family peptidase [Planctomycetota bacterium]|nr:S46 family peptidase [Planctomycetota bacterium]